MSFETICCNKTTNLNDLIYQGDCGFASYYLSIDNAEVDIKKIEEIRKAITNSLETEVKIFWKQI